MGRKKRRKTEGRSPAPGTGGGHRWRTVVLLLIVAAAVALAVASWQSPPPVERSAGSPTAAPRATQESLGSGPRTRPGTRGEAPAPLGPLVGEWLRPDGGYVLSVIAISDEGEATVDYFNPRPINVARAEARREGEQVGLFVELRDRGYPGSTYTLVYDAGSDQLRGIYFQAAQRASYEVVFVRR